MRRIKFDASIILLMIIVLLLIGGILAAVFLLRIDPVEEALAFNRMITVLFLIEKDAMPLGSYVLMYYPLTNRAAVFDIPGYTGLILSSIKKVDRIDYVYDQNDISEFSSEIQKLLGIDPIGFHIVIKIENLAKLVDLLEGVEIFVPTRIQTMYNNKTLQFPSGLLLLDGDKTVSYLTYESPDEDRDAATIRRQRFFISFLKQIGSKNESLKNPGLRRLFHSYMESPVNQRTRICLFDEFSKIDLERITVQSVGGNWREVSGQMLLLPYYDANLIKEIAQRTLGALAQSIEGSMNERIFKVEVLNGTTVSGLAGRTAELLRGFGYDAVTGNADRNDYEKTLIYDWSGTDSAAKIFGDIIRCTNIKTEAHAADDTVVDSPVYNMELKSDFTLIIGRNFNGRYVIGN